jgi:VanZ family protein
VLAVALRPRRLRYVSGGAFLGATVCGALVEFLQLGLSHRSFSVVDLAVNTAGAAAGTVIGTTIVLILGLLRRPE